MGMFDVKYTFDNLIRTTSAGLEVSSFVQTKDAIIQRYKEIFGNDIDVESTTADGQYIMMLALMLYNGYNGLYYLSQNLNPTGAQGVFLDRLCGFNNVFRRNAEPSSAYVYVKYTGGAPSYTSNVEGSNTQEITCIDKAGKLWQWQEGITSNGFPTKFKPNEIYELQFFCEENGPIVATADESVIGKMGILTDVEEENISSQVKLTNDNRGDIYATVDQAIYPFEIWQSSSAILGNDEETDTSLRQRRINEAGNNGLTVVNGILGGILSVSGVVETKLYNNVKDTVSDDSHDIVTKDGSSVKPHDVYLCVRYKDGVESDSISANIGKTLYEKLTPGIVTVPLNEGVNNDRIYESIDSNAYGHNEQFEVNVYGQILKYNLYWKRCISIHPSLRLNFICNENNWNSDKHEKIIRDTIIAYTYNLSIYDDLVIPNLLAELNANDDKINNQSTFMFIDGKLKEEYTTSKIQDGDTNVVSRFENKDTYYSYQSGIVFEFEDEVTNEESSSPYKKKILHVYQESINAETNSEDTEQNP